MTKIPALGPAATATLAVRNYDASVRAWCEYLHQHIHQETVLSESDAITLGADELSGQRVCWLANKLDEPWLQIIDAPHVTASEPFKRYGWLSLEIGVEDVDTLFESLKHSPFTVIGEPADLDVSDAIRAMQVVGLDGEVLYLTQIKAPVPPFDLPTVRCAVDRLFIPVGLVANRDEALSFYERYNHTRGMKFDTKITVINRSLGLPDDQQHPVTTIQLAGQTLIELDEVADLDGARPNRELLSGILAIGFEIDELPNDVDHTKLVHGPYRGRRACKAVGVAGERMVLIERAN